MLQKSCCLQFSFLCVWICTYIDMFCTYRSCCKTAFLLSWFAFILLVSPLFCQFGHSRPAACLCFIQGAVVLCSNVTQHVVFTEAKQKSGKGRKKGFEMSAEGGYIMGKQRQEDTAQENWVLPVLAWDVQL